MNIHRSLDRIVFKMPIPFIHKWWIRIHGLKEPYINKYLAGREEVRRILIQESELQGTKDMCPAILDQIESGPRMKAAGFHWTFVFKAAGFIAAALLGVWLYLGPLTEPAGNEEETQFRIKNINVRNEAAEVYFFQPQDSDMILIWAENSSNSGG